MEYSLWLNLPEPIKQRLDEIVTQLATKHGGPVFEPHLTLMSGIQGNEAEVVATSEQLAIRLTRLPLTLADVSFSVTYFQCVLVRVTPTAALLDAYMAAARLFNIKPALFVPHISLFYGDYPMTKRAEIAEEVQIEAASFTTTSMALTPSVPNPAEWSHIADFQLQSG